MYGIKNTMMDGPVKKNFQKIKYCRATDRIFCTEIERVLPAFQCQTTVARRTYRK